MVVGERLLRHRRRGCRHVLLASRPLLHPADDLPDAIQIAGDELQLRVLERRAAAVDDGHPAVDVGGLVVARDGQDVVGVPRQLAGQIRGLDAVPRAAAVVERPDERRPRIEIAGQLGKPDVIGLHAGDDFAADLPDRRVVVAEQTRLHFFFARRVPVLPRSDERDLAADVLAQQLLGLEQVVLVVLLEDADARRLGQRSEVHGRRIHGGGDVHEMQIGRAARDLEIADVANERDVGVVDGDGQLRLIVERGRRRILRLRAAVATRPAGQRTREERTAVGATAATARTSGANQNRADM